MSAALEERVEALEKEITDLKSLLRETRVTKDWRKTFGMSSDDPGFDEMIRLGREIRERERGENGKDQHDTLSRIIVREPRPVRQLNPRVPKDLETIVLKCLMKDAGDRYGTAGLAASSTPRDPATP